MGHVWAGGLHLRDIDESSALEFSQEHWIALFRRMHILRTDLDGAWRNKEVHERLSDMQFSLNLHPGEAPWQESIAEIASES